LEVWWTSDLRPLRLGEEKKERRRKKIETTAVKYNGLPYTRAAIITAPILIECKLYWLHSRLQSLNNLKNSVWAKYMGGPHGQKSVWAMAHTVPVPMLISALAELLFTMLIFPNC